MTRQARATLPAGPARLDGLLATAGRRQTVVQLALRAGEPVPARELLRKVWPENPAATNEDLHCRVARLREKQAEKERLGELETQREDLERSLKELAVDDRLSEGLVQLAANGQGFAMWR